MGDKLRTVGSDGSVALAAPSLVMRDAADGSLILTSGGALEPHPPHLLHYLRHWAEIAPDRAFICERLGETWRKFTYAEAWAATKRMARGLLDAGHGPDRPVMALSEKTINQAVVKLGSLLAGIPFAPVSSGYSLMSSDLSRLKGVFAMLRPSLVYVETTAPFARALASLPLGDVEVVSAKPEAEWRARPLAEYLAEDGGATADRCFEVLVPDAVGKIMLTSGSTGTPKGVLVTHRMMCSNVTALGQLLAVFPQSAATRRRGLD